ncbi:MAG: PAS domain S-box protein [Pseudomonadota bacterium]
MKITEYDLSQIIENSLTEVHIVDAVTLKFLYVNAMARANLEYTNEELLQLGPEDITQHATSDLILKTVAPLLNREVSKHSLIATHKRKSGSTYPAEVHIQRTIFNGRPALVSFVLDISEQQTTLLQLNSVIKGAALGYWDWNYQTSEFAVNDRFFEIIGETRNAAAMVSSDWQDKIHPDDLSLCGKVIQDCIELDKPYVFEFRMLHKEGHVVWVRGSGAVVARDPVTQNALRLCGTIIDISRQKQSELEREQFFTFFQLSKDMMVIADPNGCFRKVNPATIEILGYTEEELTTIPVLDFIHPDDREATITETLNQVRTGVSLNFENRFVCKDGTVRWMAWHSSFDEKDGVGYGTARDVTEYKRMVSNLFEKEEMYRTLAENSHDVIMQYDRHHRHIYTNQASLKQIGIPPEAFLGKTHEDMGFPAHLCKLWRDSIDKVFTTGMMDSFVFETSDPDDVRTINWRVFPELNAAGKVETVISVSRDLTDYKRSEEEMQKTQKLTSLGILAGGIAHDFNNILTIVFGNIALAKSQLPEGHASHANLHDAEKGFHRASRLTSQLLTFAKGGAPIIRDISIRQLIEEELLFDLSGSTVKLVIDSAPDLWLAKVDETQIAQVFSNLCFNAIQAMPKGGNFHIKLENIIVGDGMSAKLAPGKYLKFTVRDEGVGIEKQNLGKIFDPYFTTRESGLGLGLATVYSVINKHGGTIEVDSTVGEGTSFVFYLPASEVLVTAEVIPTTEVPSTEVRPARILLMDDEQMILSIAATVLKKSGYLVDTAVDGREALALYKNAIAEGRPIDCLIMDLTIPGGIGGAETMKELLAFDPTVKAIVSSGYADDPIMASYASFGFSDVLVKPFRVQSLREAVLRVLTLH